MRIARIAHEHGVDHAVLEGGTAELIADPFAESAAGQAAGPVRLGRRVDLAAARLLAPVTPRTVVGMAHNTGAQDREKPPQAFLKAPRSVTGPDEPVLLPDGPGRVDGEAELAVVLAGPLAGHTERTVHQSVFGWTVANDVTARDLQDSDPLWTAAKSRGGFTPLGPWIETGPAPADMADAEVSLRVDGRPLRPAPVAGLARGVTELLAYLGGFLPLDAGDVVLTGAPGECGALAPGARVEASVEGIGTLANPVVRTSAGPGAADRAGRDAAAVGGRL